MQERGNEEMPHFLQHLRVFTKHLLLAQFKSYHLLGETRGLFLAPRSSEPSDGQLLMPSGGSVTLLLLPTSLR